MAGGFLHADDPNYRQYMAAAQFDPSPIARQFAGDADRHLPAWHPARPGRVRRAPAGCRGRPGPDRTGRRGSAPGREASGRCRFGPRRADRGQRFPRRGRPAAASPARAGRRRQAAPGKPGRDPAAVGAEPARRGPAGARRRSGTSQDRQSGLAGLGSRDCCRGDRDRGHDANLQRELHRCLVVDGALGRAHSWFRCLQPPCRRLPRREEARGSGGSRRRDQIAHPCCPSDA